MVEILKNGSEKQNDIQTAAATLGRKGGSVTSEKKAASSRENGKKGGRPQNAPTPKEIETMDEKQMVDAVKTSYMPLLLSSLINTIRQNRSGRNSYFYSNAEIAVPKIIKITEQMILKLKSEIFNTPPEEWILPVNSRDISMLISLSGDIKELKEVYIKYIK